MSIPTGILPTVDTGGVWLRAPRDPGVLGDRQRSFLHALGRHGQAPGDATRANGGSTLAYAGAPSAIQDEARRAAEQLVASVFIQPILKELRAQNRAPAPFGPTDAEKALGPLMDAALADRIVRAQQFGLVDRIAADLGAGR